MWTRAKAACFLIGSTEPISVALGETVEHQRLRRRSAQEGSAVHRTRQERSRMRIDAVRNDSRTTVSGHDMGMKFLAHRVPAHSFVKKLWARRQLTPDERANLYASYTPPALIVASMGGHVG